MLAEVLNRVLHTIVENDTYCHNCWLYHKAKNEKSFCFFALECQANNHKYFKNSAQQKERR